MNLNKLKETIAQHKKLLLGLALLFLGVILFALYPSEGTVKSEMDWSLGGEKTDQDSIAYFPDGKKITYSDQTAVLDSSQTDNSLAEFKAVIDEFDDQPSYSQSNNTSDLYDNTSAWNIPQNPSRNVPTKNQTSWEEEDNASIAKSNTSNQNAKKVPTKEESLQERKRKLQTGRNDTEDDKTIKIVINGTQKVRNGQRATFRLSQDAFIEGILVKKNTLVSGICKFEDYRVNIKVTSIRNGKDIIFTDFTIYGMDGLSGIPVDSDTSLNGVRNKAKDEAVSETTSRIGRVGNVISEAIAPRGNNKEVTLINNHNLILVK